MFVQLHKIIFLLTFFSSLYVRACEKDREREKREGRRKKFAYSVITEMITYPLLSIRILQICYPFGIPVTAQTKEFTCAESIVRHDDVPDVEASYHLNHANLTIRHGD